MGDVTESVKRLQEQEQQQRQQSDFKEELDAKELYVWICALAKQQSTDEAFMKSQLDCDVSAAPFTRALEKASHYLIMRNERVDIYSRIWCCWELYCAFTCGLLRSAKLRISGSSSLKCTTTVTSDIKDAGASNP